MTPSPNCPPRPTITMRILFTLAGGVLLAQSAPAAPVDFAREVRPILTSQCFQCHGPDEKTRKAKLRLDLREEAIKSSALVPGKPEESELFKRICSDDPESRMPPDNSKKPALTAAQIAAVKQWITEGAKYSGSLVVLETRAARRADSSEPEVRNPQRNRQLHPLQARAGRRRPGEGGRPRHAHPPAVLRPRPGCRRRRRRCRRSSTTATRRLTRSWSTNCSRSQHHGERMAVWWLDLVRYADSIGYHSDNPMNVYPYRDYVIRAFNTNMPFDQFTIEQLAGDLLPNPKPWQRIASAYNRLLQTTEEGGAQAKEYEAKYAADRVRNFRPGVARRHV